MRVRSAPGRHWRSKEKRRRFVGKLNPISYGTFVSLHDTISAEKTTDIFFAGNIAPNSTVRTAGLSELHALKREGFAVDFADHCFRKTLDKPKFRRNLIANKMLRAEIE